jgi:hypothetical protein
LVVQAMSRIASTTIASLTVRAATAWLVFRQAR